MIFVFKCASFSILVENEKSIYRYFVINMIHVTSQTCQVSSHRVCHPGLQGGVVVLGHLVSGVLDTVEDLVLDMIHLV